MKPLKIAMMSMTHGHTRKYYQVLKENPKLDWVAVATANDEVKEIFLNSVDGIPCYDSEIEMLDAHPEIEAVVLASENSDHLRQMKLCAERGIHILSMKIPTFDMAEYDEMIELMKKHDLVCQVELEMHYNPVIVRLKDVVKSGALGELKSFNATNITLSPVWAFPWQGVPEKSYGRRAPIKEGDPRFRGGALCDHPHIFDMMLETTATGTGKMYIWNFSLVKTAEPTVNLYAGKDLAQAIGETATVSEADVNTDDLGKVEDNRVWLVDFPAIEAAGQNNVFWHKLGALTAGTEYTFSFDYYLEGEKTVKLGDAAAWGDNAGNSVSFSDLNPVAVGKSTISKTFTAAGTGNFYPMLETTGTGTGKMYIWNFSLVKTAEPTVNLYAGKDLAQAVGETATVSEADVNTDDLGKVEDNRVWLVDFPAIEAAGKENVFWNKLGALTAGTEYTFSFDYYLEGEKTVKLGDAAAWGDNVGNSVSFNGNNPLNPGRGRVTKTFTAAGTGNFYPMLETTGTGTGKMYIWNFSLVKTAEPTVNLYAGKELAQTVGGTATVSEADVNTEDFGDISDGDNTGGGNTGGGNTGGSTDEFVEPDAWLIDFPAIEAAGKENVFWNKLGALIVDTKYTFSFEYYLEGEEAVSLGDAAAWGDNVGNSVSFNGNNPLNPGRGRVTKNFTAAGTGNFYPTFGIVNEGTGKMYVWNFSLVKTAEPTVNLYAGKDLAQNINGTPTVYGAEVNTADFGEVAPGNDNTTTGESIENTVYCLHYDQYDWADNGYQNYINRLAYMDIHVKEGMELTLSYNWCVVGTGLVQVFNPYSVWPAYKSNPGTYFTNDVGATQQELWGPAKGSFTMDFTATLNDQNNGAGRMAICFQQAIDYGQCKFYFWDLKLTVKGSDENLLTDETFYWSDKTMKYIEVVDIDPDDIVLEEPSDDDDDDKSDLDTDTGDVVIDDDIVILEDRKSQISVEYTDGAVFSEDDYLSIYPYADGELIESVLAVIGDLPYVAYDIGIAQGEAFVDPAGAMKVGIPIPDEFTLEQVHLYARDAFGDLYELTYELKYGIAYFETDALGTFILVDGALTLPEKSEDTDAPVEGDEPTDTPADTKPADKDDDKDDKKADDKSNGWIVWVVIGGVVLLAAAAAALLLVLKKRKAA